MNQAGIMIAGEQMISNPVKLKRRKNYYLSLANIEEKNASWSKNELYREAKMLYYQRLIAEKKLLIISQNEGVLSLLINTSKQKYSLNQADLSTIFKAEAKLAEVANMKAMLYAQVAESNIGLSTLMNRSSSFHFTIDTTLIPIGKFSDVSDSSLTDRSDLKSMEGNIQSMRLNVDYMSSLKLPDFGIRAEHMQMYGMPNQYSIMGMITIPIAPWSSGMYKSEVKSMKHEINAMQKEKETMLLMAKRMFNEKQAMFGYEFRQLINYSKSVIPSYQKNFDAGLLAYRQNTGNLFILLDGWEMLLMKKMEYLDKYLDLLLLQSEIEYELERK
jgi:outer membrane protein, heavy metal efflux system